MSSSCFGMLQYELFYFLVQKFIELLRRGHPEDQQAAIECLRMSLAPCALDAYPVLALALHHLTSFLFFSFSFSSLFAEFFSV